MGVLFLKGWYNQLFRQFKAVSFAQVIASCYSLISKKFCVI